MHEVTPNGAFMNGEFIPCSDFHFGHWADPAHAGEKHRSPSRMCFHFCRKSHAKACKASWCPLEIMRSRMAATPSGDVQPLASRVLVVDMGHSTLPEIPHALSLQPLSWQQVAELQEESQAGLILVCGAAKCSDNHVSLFETPLAFV